MGGRGGKFGHNKGGNQSAPAVTVNPPEATPEEENDPNNPYGLSNGEQRAIDDYVSGYGMWVNQYLRGRIDPNSGFTFTESDAAFLNDLDNATNRVMDQNQTLWRSVAADAIFGAMDDWTFTDLYNAIRWNDQRALKSVGKMINNAQGKVLHEKGFMSTTKDEQVAHDWQDFTGSSRGVVLELDVPKGTRGIDLSYHYLNESQDQAEVLLHRDIKYQINEITHKNGNIYVKAKII